MIIKGVIGLKQGRDHSVKRFHPWIFSGAIQTVEGTPNEGDWVEVKDASKKTVGFGHHQKGTITVRVLSFSETPP
ncbi:MAG: class I SAM-dependent rRNA methyltransferase, partial [Chitinophagaceae bacterium]|nr:class I SAM-dependent rRNA methyltransferase [Chitinophagaceae bacterium]